MNTTTLEVPRKRKLTSPVLTEFLKPEVVRAAQNYLVARVHYEAKKAEVDALYTQMLAERPLMATSCTKADPDPGLAERFKDVEPYRITDPKDLFQAGDDFKPFYAEALERMNKLGIRDPKLPAGHCPKCIAQCLMGDAEHALVDISGEHCGVQAEDIYLEKRDQWIDLVLKLLINHPQTKRHFTNSHQVLSRFVSPPNPS